MNRHRTAHAESPQQDVQSDCRVADYDFGSNASIVSKNAENYGQVASLANASRPSGANAPNGCTYPTEAPTLFNQLDAAKLINGLLHFASTHRSPHPQNSTRCVAPLMFSCCSTPGHAPAGRPVPHLVP